MEEENKILHKINENYNYKVRRKDYNGTPFYSISVSQKLFDGQTIWGRKQVKFRKGVDIPDGTVIKIKKAFENFYKDKNNNDVFYYMILEYENISSAVEEYRDTNPFDDESPF